MAITSPQAVKVKQIRRYSPPGDDVVVVSGFSEFLLLRMGDRDPAVRGSQDLRGSDRSVDRILRVGIESLPQARGEWS